MRDSLRDTQFALRLGEIVAEVDDEQRGLGVARDPCRNVRGHVEDDVAGLDLAGLDRAVLRDKAVGGIPVLSVEVLGVGGPVGEEDGLVAQVREGLGPVVLFATVRLITTNSPFAVEVNPGPLVPVFETVTPTSRAVRESRCSVA